MFNCTQLRNTCTHSMHDVTVHAHVPDQQFYELKAGSQSDARSLVALIRETHKFITKKVRSFLTT